MTRTRFVASAAVLVGLLSVLLFVRIDAAPITRAEIYFMDGARAMVERGDFLVPHYRGEPFFDKPVLTYWLQAVAFQSFGFSPGAARAVSALAALGTLLATLWLGTLLYDRRTALSGGVILATTVGFVAFGRTAMSDMLLALWSTTAVGLALLVLRGIGRSGLPLLGVVLGLGFLTKGPIALIIPGAAVFVLVLSGRSSLPRLPVFGLVLGSVAFLVVGGGWWVRVYDGLGAWPLQYFFLRENLQRFAAATYDTQKPPWYYLTTYLSEGLPWSVFAGLTILRTLSSLRRREDPTAGARADRLLLFWVALVLVPLSLSRGKLDYYLLPLYPAVSLLASRALWATPWRTVDRAVSRAVLGLVVIGLAMAPWAATLLPEAWRPGRAAVLCLVVVVVSTALAALAALAQPSPMRSMIALGGGLAGVVFVIAAFYVPAFEAAQPNRRIASAVAREQAYRPDARFVLCNDPARVERDVLFHARVAAKEDCDLWALFASKRPILTVLATNERDTFRSLQDVREVEQFEYLPAATLTLGGMLGQPAPRTLVLVANYRTAEPVAETKRRRAYRHALKVVEGNGAGDKANVTTP